MHRNKQRMTVIVSTSLFLVIQITKYEKGKDIVYWCQRQIGVELTLALRKLYGNANVVASANMPASSGAIIIISGLG